MVKSISTGFEPRHSEKIVILDDEHSVKFWNGLLYLDYLEALTDLAKAKHDFAFSRDEMKEDDSPQSRLFNWSLIQKHCVDSPLKISVDTTTLCIAKDQVEI